MDTNKELIDILEVLNTCEEYFEDKADADWQGDPGDYVMNEEMRILGQIREVLEGKLMTVVGQQLKIPVETGKL